MQRTGKKRATTLALLLLAASQLCKFGQLRAWSQTNPPAQNTAPSTKPSAKLPRGTTAVPDAPAREGTLAVDVADPDRTPGEKPRQGLTGEFPVDAPKPEIPGTRSAEKDATTVPPLPKVSAPVSDSIATGSAIDFRVGSLLTSARQHNGDTVQGTLAAPLKTTDGKLLAPGTPVVGTIVSSTPAGTIQSGGVLSLQVTQVDGIPLVTNVRAFDGQPGHKDVADSNPAKGSEAVVNAGAIVPFKVML